MNLLAFDTSTDAMSIAVRRTQGAVAHERRFEGVGGAHASATLIPAVLDLMAQLGLDFGALDAIVFGRGPGAFTGLRSACSVAQGLAFGARTACGARAVAVLPVDSLLALAEQARFAYAPQSDCWSVLAMLDARMDQIYAGEYAYRAGVWDTVRAPWLAQPEDLEPRPGMALAGNVFASFGARLRAGADTPRLQSLPSAPALLRLSPALLSAGLGVAPEQALPLYIRDQVAATSSERAAARAAAAARS